MSELKIYNPTPRSRLFPNIEREPIVRCTAEWKTIISEAQRKGRENRTAKLSEPRLSVEGDGFILDDDSYATLSQAFIDSSGKFTGFPYKFPLDYYCTATPEYYDTGVYQQGILHPLTTTTFQICKRYSVAGICSYKTLTNIVNGTISIYKDGVLVTSGATVNLITGVVTFAVAPTGSLTISCEYRFKFRFDVDDLQLTLIRKVVEGYDGGYSAYKAINFKLVEDDYDKVSPLNVVDWTSDIAYDFSLKGSPDLTYSERVLSFIEKGDNNKEAREAFTVTRRQFKQESSNRKWKDIQRKYTLFNVAKGRLLTFDFEGVNVRFDQDEISSEIIGNNAWTFEGLSMIETLYLVGDEVKNFAHCIKIGVSCTPKTLTFTDNLSGFTNWSVLTENNSGGTTTVSINDSHWRVQTNFTGSTSKVFVSSFYYLPTNADELITFNFSITGKFIPSANNLTGQLFNFFIVQNGLIYGGGFQILPDSQTTPILLTRVTTLADFGASLTVGTPIYLALGFGNSTGADDTNIAEYWDFSCRVDVECA